MPMFLFMFPYDILDPQRSSLIIDVADYRSALQEHWPNLKIIQHPNPIYDLVWELRLPSEHLKLRCLFYEQHHICCELHDQNWGINEYFVISNDTISFYPPDHPVFEYILWHRAYIPLRYRLFLMVSHSQNQALELTATTTVSEMMRYIIAESASILNSE